jgi:hypothetical protein
MAILSPLLLWVGLLIGILAGVWMMVLGFKRQWAWGAAMALPQVGQLLFLFAFMRAGEPPQPAYTLLNLAGIVIYLCFLVVGWPETKQPFFWWLSSLLLLFLFTLTLFEADQPMSNHVARVLRAQGATQEKLAQFEYMRVTRSWFRRGPGPGTAPPGQRNVRNQRQTPAPTPRPVFQSRLPTPSVPPGQREPPQPGIYYLLERVSTKTSRGVQAALPGEKVILLERLPGKKMKVTVGGADFIVDQSQLTDDISVARELEKQDFIARGGQL